MESSTQARNILVAPLNWGLGHATRCIPIIKALLQNEFVPILASDGAALELLKKEFPQLLALELPSYNIEYPEDGKKFKWKMLKNAPLIFEAIRSEKKLVKKWVTEYSLCGILSDNRLGVISKKVPSIFITHQLNVLSGSTTWISSKMHQHIIGKFTECWIPDFEGKPNLSGKLGHRKGEIENLKHIGPLSRFTRQSVPVRYDLLILLSGPEPQRTILQHQLGIEALQSDKKILFVKGIIEESQKIEQSGNVTFYNFMESEQLQKAINESAIVVCRSGYTSIMDLAVLHKPCYFIPTPGQYEQEYLAKRLQKQGLAPYSKQDEFTFENLSEIKHYEGLPEIENPIHWKHLFCLFERK